MMRTYTMYVDKDFNDQHMRALFKLTGLIFVVKLFIREYGNAKIIYYVKKARAKSEQKINIH